MSSIVRPSLVFLGLFTLLTGGLYPAAVTGIANVVFPSQAKGSLIIDGGKVVGSELIGQPFDHPGYFWGRPSATSPHPYNGGSSTGSNTGPTNPALKEAIEARIKALRDAYPGDAKVPVDLVTASGSGLDPHISLAAAVFQLDRVVATRGLARAEVLRLIEQSTTPRTLGVLGEPVVHVLRLNRALDALAGGPPKSGGAM